MKLITRLMLVSGLALGLSATSSAISSLVIDDAVAQAKAKSIKKVFNKSAKGGPKPITPTFNKAAGVKSAGTSTGSAAPIKVKLKNAPASPKAAFNKAATPPLKPTFNQAAAPPPLRVKFNTAAGKGVAKPVGKAKTDSAAATHQLKKPPIHPKPSTVSAKKKKAEQPPPPKPKGPTP